MAPRLSRAEHKIRAELATLYRRRDRDPQRIESVRQELAATQIRDHVVRITSGAPPLTGDQRAALAELLTGGGTDAAA